MATTNVKCPECKFVIRIVGEHECAPVDVRTFSGLEPFQALERAKSFLKSEGYVVGELCVFI